MFNVSVAVQVRYKNVEETFKGDVNSVWVSVNRFFGEMIPLLDVVQGVVLTVDLGEVVEAGKGLVAVGEEGPVVLVGKERLTDSECLLLMLLAAWIGGRLGVLSRTWLSRDELRGWLGKSGKIVGTRLGELCREALVKRTEDGGGYRLSAFGIRRLVDFFLPQIRDKIGYGRIL
ncbi:MAG: hypothetical protein JSW72_05890 [Candidatus Bathyarchaeota archaeon]|nr:MAG: hypothetical protein JSW72_05890 [Candidatus Bathyarchaeota archaeon]